MLTNGSGLPLYVNEQETKGGMVLCNGSCTVIWRPLTIKNGSPTGTTAAGTLGVVTRSDGTRQVTLDGKPVYTFYTDQPGKATGDNFKDSFNSRDFTWHVVTTSGTTNSSSGGSNSGGQGGYGQSGAGSGGYGGY